MKFYMLVLALDTTTRQGSAALTRDGALVGAFSGDAMMTHGERLPGDLIRLLSAHASRIADVDLFAVAAGPGSFTGLRIGIATLQGFALANKRPLVGVSALDALDAAAHALIPHLSSLTSEEGKALTSEEGEVAAWVDAQRGQVFSAVYSGGRVVEGPVVEKPADVLSRWNQRLPAEAPRRGGGPPLFIGDGALSYRAMIGDTFPDAHIVTDIPQLAPFIARLAEAHVRDHGPVSPDAIRPIYIRRPDAELARDRRTPAS